VKIAEREERQRRMVLGLDPTPRKDATATESGGGGGEGSQENRMNELAAEKRRRRLKEVHSKVLVEYSVVEIFEY